MSKDYWSTYLNRINLSGASQKDRLIAKAQRIITDNFSDSPSYQSVTINGVSQDVRIVEENTLYKNSNKKRLLCKPDETISIGDLIVWDSENWLCTDADTVEIYVRGIIEKCDDYLRYLDSAGVLVEVPCIINDRILMNVEENRYYILPDNQVWVIVGNNDESAAITVDQRFLLGNNAYKVVAIDNITKPGITTFKLHTDSIIQNDNKDLQIADYYSNLRTYSITILNSDSVEITLGNTLQLEVECTNNNVLVTSPNVTYSLVTGVTGVVSVSASGVIFADALGSGSVVVNYNEATDSINIDVVAGIVENFTYNLLASIEPSSELKYNQTKIFNAYKYDSNGNLVTGVFEFTVTLGTGANTSNYLLSTSSDDSASLKCLQYPYNILLVATDQDLPANSIARTISLKGLI